MIREGAIGPFELRSSSRSLRPSRADTRPTRDAHALFLYLAVVLDAFSRQVVVWAMTDHLRSELVLDALEMAVTQRRPAT